MKKMALHWKRQKADDYQDELLRMWTTLMTDGLRWWLWQIYPPRLNSCCIFWLGGIDLQGNSDKTEYMCFNQSGDISTLVGSPLKLVNKFTKLGSRISSTENDISMWLAKAGTVIDRLSVIWKSDPSDKIKRIFPRSVRVHTTVWLHH